MKNQVLTIEQMQHLEELDVDTSKASMAFIKLPNTDKFEEDPVSNSERIFEYIVAMKYIPTFTLQDILEILPFKINDSDNGDYYLKALKTKSGYWRYNYVFGNDVINAMCYCNSNINSAYNTLVWCAENGYLKGGYQ